MFKSLIRFLFFIPKDSVDSNVSTVETEESMSTKVLNKVLSDLIKFPPREWELQPNGILYSNYHYKHPCLTYTISHNMHFNTGHIIVDNGYSLLDYEDSRTLYRVFLSEGIYEDMRKKEAIRKTENAIKFLDDDNRITCKENNETNETTI